MTVYEPGGANGVTWLLSPDDLKSSSGNSAWECSDGLVLSVVLGGAPVVRLIFQNKKEILGRVRNFDPDLDLAIIQALGDERISPLHLTKSRPTVGERVLAIGSPLDLKGTLTDGLISALRETQSGLLIQTNAALNPGNSGGPLLNMRGEVIGVNTLKLVGEDVEGLGFAVSAEEVRRLLGSD